MHCRSVITVADCEILVIISSEAVGTDCRDLAAIEGHEPLAPPPPLHREFKVRWGPVNSPFAGRSS